jgi:hypothetical protein
VLQPVVDADLVVVDSQGPGVDAAFLKFRRLHSKQAPLR